MSEPTDGKKLADALWRTPVGMHERILDDAITEAREEEYKRCLGLAAEHWNPELVKKGAAAEREHLQQVINANCSCGGKAWLDEDCCVACKIWHEMRVEHEEEQE